MRKNKASALLLCFVMGCTLITGCGQISSAGASSTANEVTSTTQESAVNDSEKSILTNGGESIALSKLSYYSENESNPTVYFFSDISPEALMQIYKALEWSPTGNVAVKISTGEPPASNYLRPELIADLVHEVNGTIVETNAAYGGRASTAMHLQVAEDHGFTAIADVDIMDADGEMSLPVNGGVRLTENIVGSHYANYDSFVVLSHFKGHPYGGFGGAIKNTSIGIASREGKALIHTVGSSRTNYFGNQNCFLESMAEAAKSVSDDMNNGEKMIYINVMNRLSVDCDCLGNPAEPDMHNIGILASLDPVALDQACVDLVYVTQDGGSVVKRIEERNGVHMLEHAVEIGLGSREYQFVDLGVADTKTVSQKGESMTDEEQIIAVYQKMQDAMVNKDTEYLRSVMGSTVRHITGRTQTIDEWLSDVESENMKYYSITLQNPVVTIDGNTASLTCTNVLDARIYGSRGTWSLSGGADFEKIDGTWQQVAHEA